MADELLRLERFGHDPTSTWSRLTVPGDDAVFFMVEPPWLYNRRGESCIPCGVYSLERHDSAKHPAAWALVGGCVSHFEAVGFARFACLWHPANFASQLQGCGAPGATISAIGGVQCVTSSRATMARLDELLGGMVAPQVEIRSTLAVGW